MNDEYTHNPILLIVFAMAVLFFSISSYISTDFRDDVHPIECFVFCDKRVIF